MSVPKWLASIWIVLLALSGQAAGPALNSSQMAQAEPRLRALFDKADLNRDGFLDRDELARSYRGPNAKSPEGGMYDDKGHLTPLVYQARTKYPDLVFLWAVDKDGDNRVSWAEYRQFGLDDYAAKLKQQQALQVAIQSATRQATRNRGRTAPRQQAQNVRNLQRQYAAQQRQVVNYQRNVQRYQYNMQRAYQMAMRRQWEMQQRWVNYVRQRMMAAYRVPQRHSQVVYHHAYRR